jgi:hypothetical protein
MMTFPLPPCFPATQKTKAVISPNESDVAEHSLVTLLHGKITLPPRTSTGVAREEMG